MNKNRILVVSVAVFSGFLVGYLTSESFSYLSKDTSIVGTHMISDGSMMSSNSDTSMSNMMHDMNSSLKGKTGDDFDRTFLKEMVIHHEGAVDMAKQVLLISKRPELLQLANDIIYAQTSEIQMMKNWEKVWFK